MDNNMIMRYLKNKIDGYKTQDKKAGRVINDYITAKWCIDHLKAKCEKCSTPFNIDIEQGKISTNFTAQRIDNNVAHEIDNIIAFCTYCNVASSNHDVKK